MMPSDDHQVWRYGPPGTPPRPIEIPKGVDPKVATSIGRWRGITCCSCDENCGTWMSDIDPMTLEKALPLRCPVCLERGGFPHIVWREAPLDCTWCGCISIFSVIDPRDEWPTFVDCPSCNAPIKVPRLGTALFH